jgi:hypothetical protein
MNRWGAAAIALWAILLAPDGACADGLDRVREMLDVIDAYVEARSLEQACPDWRLDRAKAHAALSEFELSERNFRAPGFLYNKTVAASERAHELGRGAACAAAASRFGPAGAIESGWMAPR